MGSFSINRNNISSVVSPQANEKPTVSLHGGVKGFDQYLWEPLLDPSASQLFTPAELATIQTRAPTSIIFQRISEDGEEGFPGKLLIEALIGLALPEGAPNQTVAGKERNLGSVIITYRAKLLDENKVTPINLTQVGPCSTPSTPLVDNGLARRFSNLSPLRSGVPAPDSTGASTSTRRSRRARRLSA